ncbi:MAG TPA: class I SAM-dependent rRNA methyltransferase, partial [Dongiaceae bacterium]|nr:class I SAM-dependent rRNA methyltransferase [Dongiaceae bacterium]
MNPYDLALVRLNRVGVTRWRSGHPWIFRAGIALVEETTGHEGLARVLDPDGRVLGTATLSRESQITLRRLGPGETVDRELLRRRLDDAIAYRERVLPGHEATRLVFGESDGLPGLIVDRYGPHLVVQFLSFGAHILVDEIVALLEERLSPASILARNDPAVRALEGLPRETVQLRGETPEHIPFREGSVTLIADPRSGQKTGAFLDQSENRLRAALLARGRVLDAFAYTGAFALQAARHADEVIAVDVSAPALAQGREQASRNDLENVRFMEANVFDFLKQEDRAGSTYDTVILDPPAFAKNKQELDGALRGYKEINLRAMKILKPGGILITCSCS